MERELITRDDRFIKESPEYVAQIIRFLLWLYEQNKESLIKNVVVFILGCPGVVLDKIVIISWSRYSSHMARYQTTYGSVQKDSSLGIRAFESFEDLIEALTKEGHLS